MAILDIAAGAGFGALTYMGGKKGGAKGAASELNGTAQAVRDVKALVTTIDGKVDQLGERVATIEGRLSPATPTKKRAMTTRRKP